VPEEEGEQICLAFRSGSDVKGGREKSIEQKVELNTGNKKASSGEEESNVTVKDLKKIQKQGDMCVPQY